MRVVAFRGGAHYRAIRAQKSVKFGSFRSDFLTLPVLPKTTLEQWAVLAAIVDHGGFAQAAAALNKSQSAVSYAVSRLQEALGVPLLAVEGRKAVCSPRTAARCCNARARFFVI